MNTFEVKHTEKLNKGSKVYFLGALIIFSVLTILIQVEMYKRNYELYKAGYEKEVETARAQSELAYKLQEAKVSLCRQSAQFTF